MKMAILTGGGDCPGLNSAIKGLTLGALHEGWQVLGIRQGWRGLLAFNSDDAVAHQARWVLPLDATAVRCIDRDGGTFLHTSRTHPGAVADADLPAFLRHTGAAKPAVPSTTAPLQHDCTAHVLRNLQKLGVDVLVPIGGDDTLSYGERLHREGFPVIGIPKTMDNDVHGTDYCLGFATAVNRTVEYLHNLRSAAGSHERFCVVECMGRNAGFTALLPAYLASVERCVIAEVPCDVARLASLLSADRENNPSRYAMLTVSEGAQLQGGTVLESGAADAYGHRKLGGIGQQIGAALQARTGSGVIVQNLGYLVRSGRPDPLDVLFTFNCANLAIELIKAGKFGQLIRLHRGTYGYAPISIVGAGKKRVDLAKFYDAENYCVRIRSVLDLPMYSI